MRKVQSASKAPLSIHVIIWIVTHSPPRATLKNATHERSAEMITNPVVIMRDALSPIERPKRPAIKAPNNGKKTIAWYI